MWTLILGMITDTFAFDICLFYIVNPYFFFFFLLFFIKFRYKLNLCLGYMSKEPIDGNLVIFALDGDLWHNYYIHNSKRNWEWICLECGLGFTQKQICLFLCVAVFWLTFLMVVSKKYIKYCSTVRLSSDACLEQTGPGREVEEDWPNRGNLRGANSVLEEWRRVECKFTIKASNSAGIERHFCFCWKCVKRWSETSSGTAVYQYHVSDIPLKGKDNVKGILVGCSTIH